MDQKERNAFLKEHYELNMVEIAAYPEKIFDTPYKAGMAMNCMRIVMNSDEDCLYGNLLHNLVLDIGAHATGQKPNVQKEYWENIAKVMGHIIEAEDNNVIVYKAAHVLAEAQQNSHLKNFTLTINQKRFTRAMDMLEKPSDHILRYKDPKPVIE